MLSGWTLGEKIMNELVNLQDLNVTCSFDVLYVMEDWSVKRGFLYQHKGKNLVLVDVEVFEIGEVILLKPYTDDETVKVLKKFNIVV